MHPTTPVRRGFFSMSPPILSPCIGICQVNESGLCEGCFRTLDEIGSWCNYSAAQREHLMDTVLPERGDLA
jgi:predicted Fe-S protein YdhL (DUF1289 family)